MPDKIVQTTSISNVLKVVDESWVRASPAYQNFIQQHPYWFQQLETDLGVLEARVGLEKLIQCYRKPLKNTNFMDLADVIYEIHGAALLSKEAAQIDLHVPLDDKGGRNFDVRAVIRDVVVNADSKTRFDDSLFRETNRLVENGVHKGYFRERALLDPHDAQELGIQVRPPTPGAYYQATPESTSIRQRLRECLERQLPSAGCNLVIFGHKEGDRADLERALEGSEFVMIHRKHTTGEVRFEENRSPTGAFRPDERGEPFRNLSGVLWVRLMTVGTQFIRAYKLYLNTHARNPLPREVGEAITAVTDAWTVEAR